MIEAIPSARFTVSLSRELVPLSAGFLITVLLGGSVYAAISVAVFLYSLVWYIDALGKKLAIVPAISLIASSQWMLAPAIYYNIDAVAHPKYDMYVAEGIYYSFVLPSTIAFILGLKFFFPIVSMSRLRNFFVERAAIPLRAAYVVLLLGVVCTLLAPYAPGPLRFLFFLGSQAIFVAVIYFFTLKSSWRWVVLVVAFGSQLLSSTESGLFHDLLLWSALTLSFVFSEIRMRFLVKAVLIVAGILIITQLQAAKAHYRFLIAFDSSRAGVVTLVDSMLHASMLGARQSSLDPTDWAAVNARFNQGWIISAVMANVPSQRDFEYGSTILLAVRDALLPRFIIDKRAVNVSDYFQEYTGLQVNERTSFGISVLGESWVNFGHFGVIFMFMFGALYGLVLRGVLKVARSYPSVILWTPLLFLQAIKSETEFVVVLNHFIKSSIFIVLTYFLLAKFLKIRI